MMMTVFVEPVHAQMSRHAGDSRTNPPAPGQHLQPGERETAEQTVFERLMHVLHGPHLGPHPTLAYFVVVLDQTRF